MARTRIDGTDGADELRDDVGGPVAIFAKGGADRIFLTRDDDLGGGHFVDAGSGKDQVLNRFEGGNEIFLGRGDDLYVADGFSAFNQGDVVHGGSGNDLFAVSTLMSSYFGDSGNDKFISVGWANAFTGGSGIDTLSYEFRHEDSTLGDTGIDADLSAGTVRTGASRTESVSGIENLIGSQNGDRIAGNGGANELKGLGGDDDIFGGGGRDRIFGGDGSDFLFGGTSADTLSGGKGSDRLEGGSGGDVMRGGRDADLMIGGTGADRFDFDALADSLVDARDVVADFSAAEGDRIDLRTIDADTGAAGDQSFRFLGDGAFTGAPGELRLSGGILSADVDGDGRADFAVELTGVTALQATDLLL